MAHIVREIVINAAPEAVLNYAGNAQTLAEWYEGVVEVNAEYDSPEVGRTFTQTYVAAGKRMDMSMEVTEYEPGRLLVLAMDGMVKGTFRWDYVAEGGGTRVTATSDYEMIGGIFGQIADKLIVEKMNTTQLEKSLENLKAKMEA